MMTRHSLLEMDKKRVILVDHNETGQAVDGIQEAEIEEIVDHHKLGCGDHAAGYVQKSAGGMYLHDYLSDV